MRADQSRGAESRHRHGRRRGKDYVFTCPSCRAVVREARPNAKVTTLLEMWIQANPGRGKSKADKEEVAKGYKPGEAVLPGDAGIDGGDEEATNQEHSDEEEEADRRLLEEVREMSLREMSQVGRAERESETRHGRRREQFSTLQVPGAHQGNHHQDGLRRHISQRLGHQSSLRSLMSGSNLTAQEMEEEVMRQIVEEGLLDGIDLENIDAEQEDEISERIAQAYRRRRRRHRSQEPPRRVENRHNFREASRNHVPVDNRAEAPSTTSQTQRRPPVSRPHLFNAIDSNTSTRPRSSSRDSGRTLRWRSQEEVFRTPRASTDLSDRPSSLDAREQSSRYISSQNRSSTDPDDRPTSQWRRGGQRGTSPSRDAVGARSGNANLSATPEVHVSHSQPRHDDPPHNISNQQDILSVSCDRCGASHIEYEVHYTCHQCASPRPLNSTYDLCQRCYRLGKGCAHWFGFGHSAFTNWEKKAPHTGPPHILHKQKYIASPASAPYLETGVFCDVCGSNANACYWHCEYCNFGDWGYCNGCVNKARHCPHPLRPLALQPTNYSSDPSSIPVGEPDSYVPLTTPTSCNACSSIIPSGTSRLHCPVCDDGDYDMCTSCYAAFSRARTVDPTRRSCPNGHAMLVVKFEHDHAGPLRVVTHGPVGGRHAALLPSGLGRSWTWEERAANGSLAQKRAEWPRDGRGGVEGRYPHTWFKPAATAGTKEEAREGQGVNVYAQWAYVPQGAAGDELALPRMAVVEEAVDVNDEWGWGVYCGRGGYFPLAYGVVVP